VYLIPTDKPTGIFSSNSGLQFSIRDKVRTVPFVGYHIYITSDEEINQQTEPCWCINTIKNTWDADLIYYQGSMPQYHYVGFKKIILTTDQNLIKDGVQSIDDEFLEWFVKNPSCEFVKVNDLYSYTNENTKHIGYKIIIPQEEPKQETLEDAADNWVRKPVIGTKRESFIAGANWQAENMYSEEEVVYFIHKFLKEHQPHLPYVTGGINMWFEQFKKK
jgi:hypothetical protein